MQNNRTISLIVLGAVLFLGVAAVTLHAAEQATQPSAGKAKQLSPASAAEESATITDDPTTAPDPAQSADSNVSFPINI